jgi:hypothetical protein
LIDEVAGAFVETTNFQESKAQNSMQAELKNPLGEAEAYYKNTIEQQKVTLSMLEADLGRAKNQIELLKKERVMHNIKEDLHTISSADKSQAATTQSQEKLNALLQQKTQELQSEKQMSESWIAELEVTSKAYENEKRKNKQLLQQVSKFLNLTPSIGG